MAHPTPTEGDLKKIRRAKGLRGEVNGLCVHAVEAEAGIPFTDVLRRMRHASAESQENVQLEANCDCLLPINGRPKRNLVICIDGTSNKFSATSSNVVGIFSHLIKDENQLAYYNSGIGAMAVTSPGTLSYLWRAFTNAIDMAFARHVDTIIMDAYRWLAENYEDGDVVYMFGFSRGAYQVRALAGMIERVGLVHKGNIGQIPFAYEMYLEQRSWVGALSQRGTSAEKERGLCIGRVTATAVSASLPPASTTGALTTFTVGLHTRLFFSSFYASFSLRHYYE